MAGPADEHGKELARLKLQLGRPVPAKAAEPNGQILDLGAIRETDPWGKNGLILKWRRWKVPYPEVHDLVLPDTNNQNRPEEL